MRNDEHDAKEFARRVREQATTPAHVGWLTDNAMDRIVEAAFDGEKAVCPFCRGARSIKEVEHRDSKCIAIVTCFVCAGRRLIDVVPEAAA